MLYCFGSYPLLYGLWLFIRVKPNGRCYRATDYRYQIIPAQKNIGYIYLPPDKAAPGTKLEVEVFGQCVPAEVAPDTLVDPKSEKIRA